jgi:four helix bundle protein
MRIRIRIPSGTRLARFRQVLLAAREAPGYRRRLQEAGLSTKREISRLQSVEETLPLFPRIDLAAMTLGADAFVNPTATKRTPVAFRSPLPGNPRTAILASNFTETETVQMVAGGMVEGLRQFRPEVIAGPLSTILELARTVDCGRMAVPRLSHGVIVFTGPEHGALDEAARDMLWQAFQVPVFEQFLGLDGNLVAFECEAHDGLHVVPSNAALTHDDRAELLLTSLTDFRRPSIQLATGFLAGKETSECACGRKTHRLTGLMALDAVIRPGGKDLGMLSSPPDLLLWQRSMELAEQIHHFSTGFPRNEPHDLRNALRRTAMQISTHIADAQSRTPDREKASFMNAAQSALAQFETHLQTAAGLEYVTAEQYRYLLESIIVLGAQLTARCPVVRERAAVPIRPLALAAAGR